MANFTLLLGDEVRVFSSAIKRPEVSALSLGRTWLKSKTEILPVFSLPALFRS